MLSSVRQTEKWRVDGVYKWCVCSCMNTGLKDNSPSSFSFCFTPPVLSCLLCSAVSLKSWSRSDLELDQDLNLRPLMSSCLETPGLSLIYSSFSSSLQFPSLSHLSHDFEFILL